MIERGSDSTLVVGAVAYDPRVVTIWERFVEYFADSGVPTDYVLFSNYEAQVAAVLDGTVQIGWNTNTAYVQLDSEVDGATKILGMRDVDVDFASVIVVPRGTSVDRPAALTGKRFACGSRDAAHASILPVHFLRGEGLDVELECDLIRFDVDLGKHGDTGASDLAVLEAVAAGRADVGVVGDAFLSAFRQSGEPAAAAVEVAWRSPAYSHCNFTALESLPASVCEAWTEALLSMSSTDPKMRSAMALEGVQNWLPGSDEGYRELRTALSQSGAESRA